MGNHRPPGQLSEQAARVPAEVTQKATRRKGALTTTLGKSLPIKNSEKWSCYMLPFTLPTRLLFLRVFGQRFGF